MRAQDLPYFGTPPIALAHRGGSGYPPNLGIENTVRAMRAAVDLGYAYLETDVHASADGVVFALHDDRLDRVTDQSGRIAQLSAAQIARARVGRDTGGDGGLDGEPVPTMAQLFEQFPAARFNIDLKAAGAIVPLWELIQRYDAHDRVCVGSFSHSRLARFRALAGPRVATSASPREAALWRFAPADVAARLAGAPAALQLPVEVTVRGVRVEVVTARLLDGAHRHGRQVHVWTIDDPDRMRRLLDLGADGIVTDRIDVLREVLLERGQWIGR